MHFCVCVCELVAYFFNTLTIVRYFWKIPYLL